MTTQTVLVSNPHTKHQALVDKIFKRIEGWQIAQQNCLITYNVERAKLPLAEKITPGHESPTVMPLEDTAWVAVSALIPTKKAGEIMDELHAIGATSMLITALHNCRF